MTIRSYAQNFEDVLLWRALGSVPDGTYVDVGAGHPLHHSVTKLFSESGWSGINVEPLPSLAEALAADRPADITVQAAVSSTPGEVVLTTVLDWDELSTVSPQRAAELVAEGRRTTEITVPAVRLDDLLADAGVREVHFLKIDVEGAELDVLRTIDLTARRPWVILLEVVSADGKRDDAQAIEEHLAAHRYLKAYHDGLNDFYVAEERSDALLPSFSVPVNVRDDFVSASGSDGVMMGRIADALGLNGLTQPTEVLERVVALRNDRVDFEHRFLDVSENLASHAARADRIAEELRRVNGTVEALELTAFARERLVAWYSGELRNARAREAALAAQVAEAERVASAERAEGVAQRTETDRARQLVHELLGSTSWRVTLPLRALRRPGRYLRSLRDR